MQPTCAGNKWTVEEDKQLIDSLNNDMSIEDIAKQHNRTVGAIKSRIKKKVVRVPIHELCKLIVDLKLKGILEKKNDMTPEAYSAEMKDLERLMMLEINGLFKKTNN